MFVGDLYGNRSIAYQNGSGNISNTSSNTFSNNLCNTTSSTCQLAGNPLFVNAAANDFRLTSASTAAIDQGTNLSPTVVDDFAGTSRPQGCCYDIGAYEFVSGGGDTTAPTVSMTAPTSGSTVSGTITVSATASDNVGVVGVQFLLNGANLQTEDTTSPYSISWNTTTVTNGSHTLTARARDAAGNQTTATGVTVTVNNTLIGDLNGDRIVNGLDWTIMEGQWFTNNPQSDLNSDGIVNSIDFSLMNANWGKSI